MGGNVAKTVKNMETEENDKKKAIEKKNLYESLAATKKE